MTQTISVNDILYDIEFELAQGIVAQDDLGGAIQAVRQHQNKARAKIFKSLKITDPHREFISYQFQMSDMLLNILQELVLSVQRVQQQIKSLRQLPPEVLQSHVVTPVGSAPKPDRPPEGDDFTPPYASKPEFRSTDEIEYIMRPEAIHVDLQARPIRFPIIGWLLTRLRILYQRPALFYTQLLETRQAPINRVLGDRILYLESLIQDQHNQIQSLRAQISDSTTSSEDENRN